MNYKAYYDEQFHHIGFLSEDDPKHLSESYILVEETQWMELLEETDIIVYDSETPSDLSKVKLQARPPLPVPEWLEKERQENLKIQQKTEAISKIIEMQAIAIAPTLPTETLLSVRYVFPEWDSLIGTPIQKAKTPYVMHEDKLYLVNQDHTPQLDWLPNATPSLYSEVAPPGVIAAWVQPVGAHDAYNKPGSGLPKSDPVTHNGKTWESTVNANSWEPGVYGWVQI